MKNTINIILSIIFCILINSCTSSINVYESIFQIENLAESKSDWEARMFSSYDRTGGNDDGFNGTYSKIRLQNGNSVLAESTGAGYVSRIWFTHSEIDKDGLLGLKGEHIKIYIDTDTIPVIDIPLESIFSGTASGFPKGLVGQSLGGWYCNVPIPYSNYFRVEVEGNGVKFYQINFQKYTGNKLIKSYKTVNAEKRNASLEKIGKELLSGATVSGNLSKEITLTVKPNRKTILEIEESFGQINQLTIETIPEKLEELLKSNIKIYWDDNTEASIDVPVNMFFAIPDANNLHQSFFTGYKDGKLYHKLPMPFLKKVKIEIESEDEFPITFQYKLKKQSVTKGYYLSTFYNEELPTLNKEQPYLWLDTKGEGHYVGTFLMTEGKNYVKNQLPIWLEGDEVFVCDGEMRIHGTGTEDYFNCGWYGVSGRLYNPESYPLHGFPQYEMNEIDKAGTAAAYRWHFLEPIPFTKDIHVTVEHGINNGVEVNYKSIAFYYLKRI